MFINNVLDDSISDKKELRSLNIQPLHEVQDIEKFNEIKNSMIKNGWVGRPVVAIDRGDYLQAITGSHRIAVADEIGLDIPCEIISESLFELICQECEWDIDMVMTNLDGFYNDLKDYDDELAKILYQDL